MSLSSFTAYGGDIAEGSAATPGLFNRRLSAISQNLDQLNTDASSTSMFVRSGSTVTLNPTSLNFVARSYDSGGEIYNVLAFGFDPTGVADNTSLLDALDLQLATTVQADALRQSTGRIYFPPGTYRFNSSLTYRGIPWLGAGQYTTKLDLRSATTGINALGSTSTRVPLDIRDMTITGASGGVSQYGVVLGYNMRGMAGLDNVFLEGFGNSGIYFADENWILAFRNVRLLKCGTRHPGGAAGIEALSTANLNEIDWHSLTVESCGTVGSGIGGGIHIPAGGQRYGWQFFGGGLESNFGAAEALFSGCHLVSLYGTYFESEGASLTSNQLVFTNSGFGCYSTVHTTTTHTGKGIRATGASIGQITGSSIDARFQGGALSVEDTSRVVTSAISSNGTLAIGASTSYSNFGSWNGLTIGDAITSAADGQILQRIGASTSAQFVRLANTSGDVYLGSEGSVAGGFFPGSQAYASVLYSGNYNPIQIIAAGLGGLEATFGNGVQFTSGVTANLSSVSSTGQSRSPAFHFASEASLGWYRSGASTIALSYGALRLPNALSVVSAPTAAGLPSNVSAAGYLYVDSASSLYWVNGSGVSKLVA
jgi:hypothetical protein